jgi:pantoate--beta-alanine ligase
MVRVFHTIGEFRAWRTGVGAATVAFVPTMGALHEGHASLVRQARTMAGAAGKAVASIFVNPTQFGPGEDFAKYPRTLEADCALLTAAGCDAVFVPSAEEMYGGKNSKLKTQNATPAAVTVDPGTLGGVLEGAIRPGHFRGVCTVVAKLLNIVGPTHLLLGQKDFQQQAVLRQMVRDLNMPVEVVTCATVREADGLAMSSRNRFLSAEERGRAGAIYAALLWAKGAFEGGQRDAQALGLEMRRRIQEKALTVQYGVAADADTLVPWKGQIAGSCVLLVAAKLGATRLIDNMVLNKTQNTKHETQNGGWRGR